jgi:glutathione reductase (NADPH)
MALAKADYNMVPTVVFSHPVIGTCGMTEEQAIERYGQENIKVYNSSFVNLWYGPFYNGGVGDKPMTRYKLVCLLPQETVIGLHAIGNFETLNFDLGFSFIGFMT